MMAVKHDIFYIYYDKESDDLTVKMRNASYAYSDEVFDDIYLIKDEKNEKIIGFQILYLKRRTDYVLKKYLPEEIYNIVKSIKEEENI